MKGPRLTDWCAVPQVHMASTSQKRRPPQAFSLIGTRLSSMRKVAEIVANLPFDVTTHWKYPKNLFKRERTVFSKAKPSVHFFTDEYSRISDSEQSVTCLLRCKGRTEACTLACGKGVPFCLRQPLKPVGAPRFREGTAALCACGKPNDSHRTVCPCQGPVDGRHFECQWVGKVVLSGKDLAINFYEGLSNNSAHAVDATQPYRAMPQVSSHTRTHTYVVIVVMVFQILPSVSIFSFNRFSLRGFGPNAP
jgi:hypothetical protein